MAESLSFHTADKAERYREMLPVVRSLIAGDPDLIANLANVTAVLKECITAASWVGFYLMKEGELVLGPFQGKVACMRIAMGRGVCGKVAQERRTLVVPDVNDFPDHIACDAASRSEVVVPLMRGDTVLGVLDVDSHELAAFDEVDARALEELAAVLSHELAW